MWLSGFNLQAIQDLEGARRAILELMNLVESMKQENQTLRDEVQRLRDELNRLKGEQAQEQGGCESFVGRRAACIQGVAQASEAGQDRDRSRREAECRQEQFAG